MSHDPDIRDIERQLDAELGIVDEAAKTPPAERQAVTFENIPEDDTPVEDVHVPEWGGWITMVGMTGEARDALERRQIRESDVVDEVTGLTTTKVEVRREEWRATVVALTACKYGTRDRLFRGDSGIKFVNTRAAAIRDRLYDIGARLSGLNKASKERAEKNSENGHSSAPLLS